MNRCLLPALLAGCLAPGLALAQTELPEEQAFRVKVTVAEAATARAYKSVEDYGRGAPIRKRPDHAQALRDRARERLDSPLRERNPVRYRAPRFHAANDEEHLRSYREAIIERLHDLDPKRFPRPKPPPEPPEQPLRLKIFEVQDLIYTPTDHIAPPVGLGSFYGGGGGGGSGGVAAGGALSFDDEEEDTGTGIDSDKLIELVESQLGVEDEEGSVEFSSGRLIVRKTPRAIAKIARLLKQLESDRGGLVDLEVRIYRMPPALFARLRKDATALSDASEAALTRATADGTATLLSSHRVVAHDGQRVHVRRGASRSFVADIDINQTGIVPVINPQVNVINEGLVVELRPIVDRERRVVLLDVALSLSSLRSDVETRKIEGVELELPHMDIARTGASTCVPLGRGALLGGVFKIDGEASKPLTSVVYVRPQLVRSR